MGNGDANPALRGGSGTQAVSGSPEQPQGAAAHRAWPAPSQGALAPAPQRPTQCEGAHGCRLPGIQLSEPAKAAAKDVLKFLRARGTCSQRVDPPDSRDFPRLLTEVCKAHRLTVLDLQALILRPWDLSFGTVITFPSKEQMFAFVRKKLSPDHIGELTDLNIPGPHLNPMGKKPVTMRSGRWVELLDGVTVVRLMTATTPAVARPWADTSTIKAALRSLRQVRWSPQLHFALPHEYRRRMIFLACLGSRLRLTSVWDKVVLPFLAALSPDEMQAATSGMRRPGQEVLYYSTTSSSWRGCRVTAVDPASGSIMVNLKPHYWITREEQASCISLYPPHRADGNHSITAEAWPAK